MLDVLAEERLGLLDQRGIAQAEVEYDGSSDSGQVEHQRFFDQDDGEPTVQERGVLVAVATA